MAKLKFSIEAGALYRRAMRTQLNKLKADILYEDPDANVEILESKSLLESSFTFIVTGTKDYVATACERAVRKWAEELGI